MFSGTGMKTGNATCSGVYTTGEVAGYTLYMASGQVVNVDKDAQELKEVDGTCINVDSVVGMTYNVTAGKVARKYCIIGWSYLKEESLN